MPRGRRRRMTAFPMNAVFLVGRILLATIFLFSAIDHITRVDAMSGHAKSKHVPFARAGVIVTGVLALVAGLSLVLGVWTDLGALLLVVFLVPVTLLMHSFWTIEGPQVRSSEQINFNKNLAILGGASILFYMVNTTQDVPLGLTGPLFGAI